MTLREVKSFKKEMSRNKDENEIFKKAIDIFATRN